MMLREPKSPTLLGPKSITRIGCWNIRTMLECGKAAQVARESILDTRREKTMGKTYNNLEEFNRKRGQGHALDLE